MINLQRVNQLKDTFYFLSHLIDYPQAELQDPEFLVTLRQTFTQTPQTDQKVIEIAENFAQQPLTDLQQAYANYFEMNKRYTLYMTFYRFEDSRQRGQVLAKLKMLYEMFGVSAVDQELTDYLPLMLEFLAYGDWQNDPEIKTKDLQLVFSVVEDGTYQLLKHGTIYQDTPYFQLIKIIRQELGSCVTQHQISQEVHFHGASH